MMKLHYNLSFLFKLCLTDIFLALLLHIYELMFNLAEQIDLT